MRYICIYYYHCIIYVLVLVELGEIFKHITFRGYFNLSFMIHIRYLFVVHIDILESFPHGVRVDYIISIILFCFHSAKINFCHFYNPSEGLPTFDFWLPSSAFWWLWNQPPHVSHTWHSNDCRLSATDKEHSEGTIKLLWKWMEGSVVYSKYY